MPRKKDKLVQLDEDVFEVERLLNQRIINQRTEYLVKWRGYPNENNTWEPEDNIYDQSLITDFNRFLEKQFARKFRSGNIDSDDGNSEEEEEAGKREHRAKRKKSKLRHQANSSSGDNKTDSGHSSRKKRKIIEDSPREEYKKFKLAMKPPTNDFSPKSRKAKGHSHKHKHRSDRHGKHRRTSSKSSGGGPCSSATDKKKKKKHKKSL